MRSEIQKPIAWRDQPTATLRGYEVLPFDFRTLTATGKRFLFRVTPGQ